jgi:6-pyruvoyltetrahydropterin/6-carboxytetrahydropterin synthase
MNHEQFITRNIEIDIAHRVMHERFKCYSVHGHRVRIELTFVFSMQKEIGYCIDFKEIKRVGGGWINDMMDHGFLGNPEDTVMINACNEVGSKLYLLSLNGEHQYCNPTAENIARELFIAMGILFAAYEHLNISQVRYFETPNCWVEVNKNSIRPEEQAHFYNYRGKAIEQYAKNKGIIEYDVRKAPNGAPD